MRLFVSKQAISENVLYLSESQFHYVSRVRRVQKNELLELVCDERDVFRVRCLKIYSGQLHFESLEIIPVTQATLSISVVQALPKQDKMSEILDALTQLGASEFYPVETCRTVVKWTQDKAEKHVKRWQQRVSQAAMQSCQTRVPDVHSVLSFDQWLSTVDFSAFDACLLLYEDEKKEGLKDYLESIKKSAKSLCVFIGPEGGIAQEEKERLCRAGFRSLSLGDSIYRVELAGIIVLSQVHYAYKQEKG